MTQAATTVVLIGPLDGAEGGLAVAWLAPAIAAEQVVFVQDAEEGLAQVVARLGHREVICEPGLAGAAQRLGLPCAPLEPDDLERRADVALALDSLADPPAPASLSLRRYLLQGLGCLHRAPAWRQLDDGCTAAVWVEGRSGSQRCDAEGSVSFGFAPTLRLHVVLDGPEPADIEVLFEAGPAHVVEALSRAYALPFRPEVLVDGRPPPPGWLDRWAPAIGSWLYLLGLVDAQQTGRSLRLTDPLGVELACGVQMRSWA